MCPGFARPMKTAQNGRRQAKWINVDSSWTSKSQSSATTLNSRIWFGMTSSTSTMCQQPCTRSSSALPLRTGLSSCITIWTRTQILFPYFSSASWSFSALSSPCNLCSLKLWTLLLANRSKSLNKAWKIWKRKKQTRPWWISLKQLVAIFLMKHRLKR